MPSHGVSTQDLESIPLPLDFRARGPREIPGAAGRILAHGLLLLLLAVLVAGCGPGSKAPDPAILTAYRNRFLLTEEPAAAMGVLELRTRLLDSDGDDRPAGAMPEPIAVSVVGTVGGIPNPWGAAEPAYPWRDGQAKFFLSDIGIAEQITKHSQDPPHKDGHACPFCGQEKHREAVAIVQFLAEDDAAIDIDARPLLGLKGGETIVLRGTASLLGQGKAACLLIAADGLYVRAPPPATP